MRTTEEEEEDESMVSSKQLVKRRRDQEEEGTSQSANSTTSTTGRSKFLDNKKSACGTWGAILTAIVATGLAALLVTLGAVFVWHVSNASRRNPIKPPLPSFHSSNFSVMNHTHTLLSFGPRTIHSQGHDQTRRYLERMLALFGWRVETVEHEYQRVPRFQGPVVFRNIIATYGLHHPNESRETSRRLLLACHYDSKIFDFVFLGATDSAVPCAMLLHLAEQIPVLLLNASAVQRDEGGRRVRVSEIQLVFFDGEEAIENWSAEDSLYGARALAQQWERENRLSSISLFVLLDLIGTAGTKFYNYELHFQRNVDHLYNMLADAEAQLNTQFSTRYAFFSRSRVNALIEDDHVPFFVRGVPVLHIIPCMWKWWKWWWMCASRYK